MKMNYNFVPRFYYTLNFKHYLFPSKKDSNKSSYCLFETNDNILNFNNARTSLRVLLNSISGKSLKVGVQAYTCHTIFQAINNAGHKIIFLDLDNEIKLDRTYLKKKLEQIDVLIVTHTFGFPEDVDAIKQIIGDKIVIEDCAHSFLSKYKNNYTGALGDAAIFTTGLGKFPPIGSGGFCVVNEPSKFPLLKNEYAKISKTNIISSVKDYIKILILSIMTKPPLYGAITYKIGKKLDSKIDFVNKFSFPEAKGSKWVERIFKNNFSFFEKILVKNSENLKLLSSYLKREYPIIANKENITPNYYALPLLIKNRDTLYDKLLENNIEAGKHFHKSIGWASEFGYKIGECPNTEKISKQILTVPVHFGLKKKTIKKISKIINEYHGK